MINGNNDNKFKIFNVLSSTLSKSKIIEIESSEKNEIIIVINVENDSEGKIELSKSEMKIDPDCSIILNFNGFNELSISEMRVFGSIVAPSADLVVNDVMIEGNIFVKNLFGNGLKVLKKKEEFPECDCSITKTSKIKMMMEEENTRNWVISSIPTLIPTHSPTEIGSINVFSEKKLQSAISNNANIINIKSNIILSQTIFINKIDSLVINGNDFAIDGNNEIQCFSITDSSNITINNLIIKNGNSIDVSILFYHNNNKKK